METHNHSGTIIQAESRLAIAGYAWSGECSYIGVVA